MKRSTLPLLLAAAATVLGACNSDTPASTLESATVASIPDDHGAHAKSFTGALTVDQKQGIAAARRATARFHDFTVAQDAGYTVQFPTGCAELPGTGAQAYHYMNAALVDDVIDVNHPELLMYEPRKDGSLQLVGLDYVTPRPEGTMENEPEPLLGMRFAPLVVQGVSVWALHIWAWRPNPLGVFMPWNPSVSCKYQFDN